MYVYMYMYMDVHDQSQTKRRGQLFHESAQPCYSLLAELFHALKCIMIVLCIHVHTFGYVHVCTMAFPYLVIRWAAL